VYRVDLLQCQCALPAAIDILPLGNGDAFTLEFEFRYPTQDAQHQLAHRAVIATEYQVLFVFDKYKITPQMRFAWNS
jgi:hypothetical protein